MLCCRCIVGFSSAYAEAEVVCRVKLPQIILIVCLDSKDCCLRITVIDFLVVF